MPVHENPKKGSGKSFRMLLEAIILASQGNRVQFLCNQTELSKWYWRKAVTMIDVYCAPNTLLLDAKKESLTFPNGGELVFRVPVERMDIIRPFTGIKFMDGVHND